MPFETAAHCFPLCAVVTVVLQLACFFIAFTCKFDTITDFAGGMTFTLLAVMTLLLGGLCSTRQIVVTSMVVLTRTELALILLYRVVKRGRDARFDEMREKFCSFLAFWIFQIVWVYVVSFPIIFLNLEPTNPKFGDVLDFVGIAMFCVGFLVQLWADITKIRFRADPANNNQLCDIGIWYWSRHPNYFGEILLWWGVFVTCMPVFRDSGEGIFTVASPLLTMFLLLFVSGMPTGEGKNHQRFFEKGPETRDAFLKYFEQTSPLIPCPPCLYGSLPLCLKQVFFFEFPMYAYREPLSQQHFREND